MSTISSASPIHILPPPTQPLTAQLISYHQDLTYFTIPIHHLFSPSPPTPSQSKTPSISHITTTHDTFPQPPKSNLIRFSLIDHRQVSECGATHAPKIAHIPSCLPFATLKQVKRARCVAQHPRRPEHVKGVTMKVALLPESWSFVVEGVKGKQNSVKQNLM
jgi:hypothetical protein